MGMPGYTKLFSSILASTIWREDDKTRIVWITLLAMADKNGIAECSVPGLADMARVSVEDCRKAIHKLQQPDPDSRTQDNEGRRIEPTPGGFAILNHGKYRAKLNQDERREYLKIKQAEYRKRKRESTNVNNVSNKSTELTHTEAKAEAYTKAVRTKPSSRCASTDSLFDKAYLQYPRHVGKRAAEKAWINAVNRTWGATDEMEHKQAEDMIYQRVMTYAAVCERAHKEKQFIPHMATWLNQDRFMDDPSEWAIKENRSEYVNKGKQRQDASNDAIGAALARITGEAAGDFTGRAPLLGCDDRDGGSIFAGNGSAGRGSGQASSRGSDTQLHQQSEDVSINRGDKGASTKRNF